MSDSNPTAPLEPASSRVPAPASSHIDEAVAHSHEHAHFAGGGHGGHGHDHSHAGASAKRLGWALAVTGAVVIAESTRPAWSSPSSRLA